MIPHVVCSFESVMTSGEMFSLGHHPQPPSYLGDHNVIPDIHEAVVCGGTLGRT